MTGGRTARVSEPIILLGAPRSGTTLVANLLDSHPDVAAAREPRLVWRFGNDKRSDELRPRDASTEVIDHIHTTFAAMLDERGRTRLAEKTPANSVRPAFVDAVFPDARFVHITRNGWGAIPSMRSFWERRGTGLDGKQVTKLRRRLSEARPSQLRHYIPELIRRASGSLRHSPLYGPRLAGIQQIVDELGHLEAAARQWRTCVDQSSTFGRSLPSERYLEIHLETLDSETMTHLLRFCDLAASPAVLDEFAAIFDRDVATRRAELTADEEALIAPFVRPANAWLGYQSAPDVHEEPPPPTRV